MTEGLSNVELFRKIKEAEERLEEARRNVARLQSEIIEKQEKIIELYRQRRNRLQMPRECD